MKTIKIMILVSVMMVMVAFGGLVTTNVAADEPTAEPAITEEVIVEEDAEEPAEEVVEEPAEEVEVADDEDSELTPAEIITSQRGLHVDYIEVIDSYGNWGAYYCHCDGDLYCITIKNGTVDVCVILN
jgi:hypothetical protein